MARLRDIPRVVKRIGAVTLFKRVWGQLREDDVFTWGAALAYSWLFAIFPFLVFLLSLVPLLPDRFKPNVQDDVTLFVDQTMPANVGDIVKSQINSLLTSNRGAGGFLSFGLVLTIWAASGGVSMTMAALDKAYDIERGRPYYKHRLVAICLTVVVATLFILLMILMPIGSGVIYWLKKQGTFFWWIDLLNVVRYAIALLLMFIVLAIIYHFGPSKKQKFFPITPGAAFCVAVWLILGAAFKLYLTKFGGAANYNKTYGTVAGAAILLLFFYIDALVLLIGAEINSEIDVALERRTRK